MPHVRFIRALLEFCHILAEGKRDMREIYHTTLKHYFHQKLIHVRMERKLTQAAMAELLEMDNRSYVDLDHGKTCCSATTFALYLIYVCEDVAEFLRELRDAFEAEGKHVA